MGKENERTGETLDHAPGEPRHIDEKVEQRKNCSDLTGFWVSGSVGCFVRKDEFFERNGRIDSQFIATDPGAEYEVIGKSLFRWDFRRESNTLGRWAEDLAEMKAEDGAIW